MEMMSSLDFILGNLILSVFWCHVTSNNLISEYKYMIEKHKELNHRSPLLQDNEQPLLSKRSSANLAYIPSYSQNPLVPNHLVNSLSSLDCFAIEFKFPNWSITKPHNFQDQLMSSSNIPRKKKKNRLESISQQTKSRDKKHIQSIHPQTPYIHSPSQRISQHSQVFTFQRSNFKQSKLLTMPNVLGCFAHHLVKQKQRALPYLTNLVMSSTFPFPSEPHIYYAATHACSFFLDFLMNIVLTNLSLLSKKKMNSAIQNRKKIEYLKQFALVIKVSTDTKKSQKFENSFVCKQDSKCQSMDVKQHIVYRINEFAKQSMYFVLSKKLSETLKLSSLSEQDN